MNKKQLNLIKEVKRDCLILKKKNELTEFGEGELMLIQILEELK